MTAGAKGVGRKARRAIGWSTANAIATNLVRLVVFAVLSRLLDANEFGAVVAAMTVILFAQLLRDFGVGQALIQRMTLEREHIEVAFTVALLQGALLTVAIVASADLIAGFFRPGRPDAVLSPDLVRALAGLFIVRSLAVVPSCLLQRELRFRALSTVDFLGYCAGAITSITLAAHDLGAWALVAGYAVETAIQTVLVLVLRPPPLRLALHRRHLRELLGFGVPKSIAGIGNYLANQGDYFVIGNLLNTALLGIYQRAYELVRFPANVFNSVAGSVLFSAFSRVQNDAERMGRVFRRTTFACALVLLPASAGLIVLAPEVIRILMGDRWDHAVWPFRIMALAMLFRTTYKLGGLVGRSTGEVWSLARWQWLYAVFVIGGALLSASTWGILGVACTTTIAVTVNFLGMSHLALRMTTLSWRDLMGAHVVPLAVAVAVGGTAWLVAHGLRTADVSFVVVSLVATSAGSLMFLGLVALGLRRGGGDWPWLKATFQELLTKVRGRRKVIEPGP